MGINGHIPCEVVNKQMERGDRELVDIRLEQPMIHISTTIGHTRHEQCQKINRS